MAPPFGFTLSELSGKPKSRVTAKACAAKASLSSITSICSKVRLACLSSFLMAGAGAKPIMRGSTPTAVEAMILARGFKL